MRRELALPAGAGGHPRRPARFLAALLLVLATAASACAVRMTSEYDEITDRSATELQKKVEGFVTRMMATSGTPAGEYARNEAAYDELMIDARSLKMRASVFPKNSLTVQHVEAIEQNLGNLRSLHRLGGSSGLRPAVAQPALAALNQQFQALITLEIAKRRGRQ